MFRFLDLPSEIRMLVYKTMFIKRSGQCDSNGIVRVGYGEFWAQSPLGAVHVWTHPLLRSNRQIRYEGLDIFFKHNSFSFSTDLEMGWFLLVIEDFGRERIRKVCLESVPGLAFGLQSYETYEWTQIENYLRNLARLPNLRSLQVARSPFHFQEVSMDGYDEDMWFPDIDTIDVHESAFRSAYLGWIPLHIRGLKQFSIDWGDLQPIFNAEQISWYQEVERNIQRKVTQPKPEDYFQNRVDFIFEKLDPLSLVQWTRCIFYPRVRPTRLLNRFKRPSNYYSTFAFDHAKYQRRKKWRDRGMAVPRLIGDWCYEVRHPRTVWRRWQCRHGETSMFSDDSTAFHIVPPLLAHLAVPPIPTAPPAATTPHQPSLPPPQPAVTLQPAFVMPAPTGVNSSQQAVIQTYESNDGALDSQDLWAVVDLEPSESATVSSTSDGDDDEIPLESLTDPRASGSLPSLLRGLNVD